MVTTINATTTKDVAKYVLDELGVSKPYVLDFEGNDRVYLFEAGETPRRIMLGSELYSAIKAVERRTNVKVCAVTHDHLEIIGETYSFLCVSPYPEDWEHMLRKQSQGVYNAYAYVWNVSDELCSEFGYIRVNVNDGNIRRVG